jgi:hypothetical protein
MEYVKVDSSLIDSVGYGDGLYGPETLGIKFPPNKKQKEAKESGSEYHYGGMTQEQYQEFVGAESVGSYFGKFIKSSPHLYPFTKVEAPDPQQPHPTTTKPNGSGTNATVSTDGEMADTPSPGTALALIDGMADDKLFSPGSITDAQLAQMRQDWLTEAKKYDISTDKARTELKRFARPLQKLRTGIEARAKELTGATKRKIAAIDTEKRRLVLIVAGIEDEVLAPLTAWEQEEDERKARLAGEVKAFADAGQVHIYPDTVALGAAIHELESVDVSTFQEYKVSAESAIAASLRVLKPELERRKQAEVERAELEALRAAAAKRAEDDRIAAAAKKLADEQVAAAVEAAKVETRQEVIAEMKPQAVILAPTMEEIADVQPFEYPEAEAVSTGPQEHHLTVWAEAQQALIKHLGLDVEDADNILELIENGLIPHVSINY